MGTIIELIEGTPGGGKTTRMVDEVIRLVTMCNVDPRNILVLTFTRRAQREAVMRLARALKVEPKELTNVRTIHSYCMGQLGIKRDQIITPAMMREFGEEYGYYFSRDVTDEASDTGHKPMENLTRYDKIHRLVQLARNTRIRSFDELRRRDPDTSRGISRDDVSKFAADYRQYRRRNNLFDYTDLLELFREPFKYPHYIFVDEGQDLTFLQWYVVSLLTNRLAGLYVYRDANQAIYTWGGADPRLFEQFFGSRDVNQTLIEYSFRCMEEIGRGARHILNQITDAVNPGWQCQAGGGAIEYMFHESPWLNNALHDTGDVLILARANYMLSEYITAIRRQGLTYKKGFHDCREYKAVVAMALLQRLLKGGGVNRTETRQLQRWTSHKLRLPADDTLQLTLAQVFQESAGTGILSFAPSYILDRLEYYDKRYFDAIMAAGTDLTVEPHVHVSTIHASKGAEADTVILDTRGTNRTLRHRRESVNFDNEARVWYVGATRARKRLILLRPSATASSQVNQPAMVYGVTPTSLA